MIGGLLQLQRAGPSTALDKGSKQTKISCSNQYSESRHKVNRIKEVVSGNW
jgi:hypothetical protein